MENFLVPVVTALRTNGLPSDQCKAIGPWNKWYGEPNIRYSILFEFRSQSQKIDDYVFDYSTQNFRLDGQTKLYYSTYYSIKINASTKPQKQSLAKATKICI